jgi:ubiquinone/menaquinone biosynthesis C-methylase UbiE
MTTDGNTYLLDPESPEELARLARQGRLITRILGLLPGAIDLKGLPSHMPGDQRMPRVLDIGCGPGEWVLELAAKNRHLEVVGIDISERMVSYASAEAENRETPNASFLVMNALKPMDFSDNSFDLVHIRTALAFVPRDQWPTLYEECRRLLRNNGLLVHAEAEGSITTCDNPASAKMMKWICQALWMRGLGFWDGESLMQGIHAMQVKFAKGAGFQEVQEFSVWDDSSYGNKTYYGWLEHLRMTTQGIKPLVCGPLGVPEETFNATMAEAQREITLDTYVSRTAYLSVVGKKMTRER